VRTKIILAVFLIAAVLVGTWSDWASWAAITRANYAIDANIDHIYDIYIVRYGGFASILFEANPADNTSDPTSNDARGFRYSGDDLEYNKAGTWLNVADPTGEANTASNVGGQLGIYKQKTDVDLEFYTMQSLHSALSLYRPGDVLQFDVIPGAVPHFLLQGLDGDGVGKSGHNQFPLMTGETGALDWGDAASLRIPSGTDPDVSTAGQLGADTDDHALRGYDGTNQFVYGQKLRTATFTITSPLDLVDAATTMLWENRSGFTFNITAIYSKSDTDDVGFTLKETAGTDFTSLTTIEAITISTNGTGVFYNDLTSGIDHTAIENGNCIVYDNDATDDPDWVSITIVGWFNADVD